MAASLIKATWEAEGKLGLSFEAVTADGPASIKSIAVETHQRFPQLRVGLVLVAVQGDYVIGTPFQEALGKVKVANRPLSLTFASGAADSPRTPPDMNMDMDGPGLAGAPGGASSSPQPLPPPHTGSSHSAAATAAEHPPAAPIGMRTGMVGPPPAVTDAAAAQPAALSGAVLSDDVEETPPASAAFSHAANLAPADAGRDIEGAPASGGSFHADLHADGTSDSEHSVNPLSVDGGGGGGGSGAGTADGAANFLREKREVVQRASPAAASSEDGREEWDKGLEFLLSVLGYAVGLGNVCWFPYKVAGNGGATFLIPYTLCLFVLGVPLMLLEFAIGQRFRKGTYHAMKSIDYRVRSLGVVTTYVSYAVAIFYNVLICWSLYFFILSLTPNLPWATPTNCTDMHGVPRPIRNSSATFFWHCVLQVPAEYDEVAGEFGTKWTTYTITRLVTPLVISLGVSWGIICFAMSKGIKTSGKVVYVTATMPYFFLSILLVRGMTLEGAMLGIEYYLLTPNWSKLWDPTIWTAGAPPPFLPNHLCSLRCDGTRTALQPLSAVAPTDPPLHRWPISVHADLLLFGRRIRRAHRLCILQPTAGGHREGRHATLRGQLRHVRDRRLRDLLHPGAHTSALWRDVPSVSASA